MIQPRPATTFEWLAMPAGDALVCRPLARSARHLFTSRPWRLGSGRTAANEDEWEDVARALDVAPDRLRRVRQVHGADVVVEKAGRPPCGRGEADIIATDDDGTGLAIRTADCVPLLIADQRTGAVAAAHAGWRGLVMRVPSITVDVLATEFGAHASDLVAAIGPSIGPCCYEIGDDVREQFGSAGFAAPDLTRWFTRAPRSAVGQPAAPGPVTGATSRAMVPRHLVRRARAADSVGRSAGTDPCRGALHSKPSRCVLLVPPRRLRSRAAGSSHQESKNVELRT